LVFVFVWGCCVFFGWGGGLGGEMTQALYVHMNNKTIKEKKYPSFLGLSFLICRMGDDCGHR
jgi:hypothetical protein